MSSPLDSAHRKRALWLWWALPMRSLMQRLMQCLMQCLMQFLRRWAVVVASSLGTSAAWAGEVHVAVASHFASTMKALSIAFTAATGHVAQVSTGSTGKFYSQVRAGAPFDVLLAADQETPARLLKEGFAVPGSSFTYAQGQLVLWGASAGVVDGQGAVLAGGQFKHLAIANPKTAPYGQAAMQVLQARGLLPALQSKLVTGESVAQAYQFVATGNAELGFVALSQVAPPGLAPRGSLWRVPPELYTPLRHDAVLLQRGATNPAALALLDFLKTPAARTLMQSWGYRF